MNHLGFSIQEANGTLVLILILSIFIFAPPLFNGLASSKRTIFESDASEILKWKNEFEIVKKEISDKKNLSKKPPKAFDPNILGQEKWIEYGIKPAVARRIINFRNAGGSFKKSTDLLKIYGVDSASANNLIPYMEIPSASAKHKKPNVIKKEKISAKAPLEKSKLNINLATEEDLKSIYGIGDKLSKRITSYRSTLGGYHSLRQLAEVYFLEDSLLPKIDREFTFDTNLITPLLINTDSIHQLKRHPYLNYNMSKAIVSYRDVHGKFASPEDLLSIKIISDSTFQKLKPYISVKD